MASEKELSDSEKSALDSVSLDGIEINDASVLSSVEDIEEQDRPAKKLKIVNDDADEPPMTSPKWQDFVLSQFEPDEVDKEGNPFVSGLRRVAKLLLGRIVRSQARVVQAPQLIANKQLSPAVVEYTVEFLWTRDLEDETFPAYSVTYTDVADVYFGNTELDYARHATATAATKAEGRCLRKALQLQRVVAAEELTLVPLDESGIGGFISNSQINFIDILCQRSNINVMRYLNSGKSHFSNVRDVPSDVAAKMTEHLSGLLNDPSKVPDNIKGYERDWNKK